jgi:hypothetical protein
MRALALSMIVTLSVAAAKAGPTHSGICRALTTDITDFSHSQPVAKGSILEALGKWGRGSIRLDPKESAPDEPLHELATHEVSHQIREINQWAERHVLALRLELQRKFRLSSSDAESIAEDAKMQGVFFSFAKGSRLLAVETVGGSAHCQSFRFFDTSGSGPAKSLDLPEAAGDGNGYCGGGDLGEAGIMLEAGREPVFAVEHFADGNEQIRLFVRAGAGWSGACQLAVSWQPEFAAAAENCDGASCPTLKEAAFNAVKQYDSTKDLSSYWAAAPAEDTPDDQKRHLADYLGRRLGNNPLYSWPTDPTPILAGAQYHTMPWGKDRSITAVTIRAETKFGTLTNDFAITDERASNVPSIVNMSSASGNDLLDDLSSADPHNLYYNQLSGGSTIFPLLADGKLYLARLGHGYFGWRESDDYLVNVLEPDEAGYFKRAAGFIVTKTRGHQVAVKAID